MPTEEGIESLKKRLCNVPHWFGSRSPHPPVSTGTFSPWEKDVTRFGLSKQGTRSSQWEELSADAD